jgi:hypothetical protein
LCGIRRTIEREPRELVREAATPAQDSPSDILCVRGSFADDPHFSVRSLRGLSGGKVGLLSIAITKPVG